VQQWHAFRLAGGARGVQDERELVVAHGGRLVRPGIEQRFPLAAVVDAHGWQPREQRPTLRIDEHQRDRRVLLDVGHGRPGQLEVDRHGDHAGAHDPDEGDEVLGAVRCQQPDAGTALEAAAQEAACHRVGLRMEVGPGDVAHRTVGGDLGHPRRAGRCVARNHLAQVAHRGGHARARVVHPGCAP
jgi:hypothetical protein